MVARIIAQQQHQRLRQEAIDVHVGRREGRRERAERVHQRDRRGSLVAIGRGGVANAHRLNQPTLPGCRVRCEDRSRASGREAASNDVARRFERVVQIRRVRVGDTPPAHGAAWLGGDARVESGARLGLVKIVGEHHAVVETLLRRRTLAADGQRVGAQRRGLPTARASSPGGGAGTVPGRCRSQSCAPVQLRAARRGGGRSPRARARGVRQSSLGSRRRAEVATRWRALSGSPARRLVRTRRWSCQSRGHAADRWDQQSRRSEDRP
eukprot:4831438-Prymnesium_polylepis.2